jgi:hypothetical protein
MRCPKCSFISFDIVESCTKCGKNISKAAEGLMGTIAEVVAPIFLKFETDEQEPEVETLPEAEGLSEEEVTVDLGDEEQEEVEFSLDEASEPEAEAVDFEIGEDEEEEIGISDLAPSEEMVSEPVEEDMVIEEKPAEEEMVFEEEHAAEAVSSEDHEAGELEDLEVDGIDLESKPAAGDRVMPSVKTGTALDDFDIDLGDLITGKKE